MLHVKRHHVITGTGANFFLRDQREAEDLAKTTSGQYMGYTAVPAEHLPPAAQAMWPNVPAFADTVARMKSEILAHVRQGRVPRTVSSFSELHDYVDANCYGGFCDDNGITDALIEAFGGRDENEGMPDQVIEYMNDAQDAIHEWLQEGGLTK